MNTDNIIRKHAPPLHDATRGVQAHREPLLFTTLLYNIQPVPCGEPLLPGGDLGGRAGRFGGTALGGNGGSAPAPRVKRQVKKTGKTLLPIDYG